MVVVQYMAMREMKLCSLHSNWLHVKCECETKLLAAAKPTRLICKRYLGLLKRFLKRKLGAYRDVLSTEKRNINQVSKKVLTKTSSNSSAELPGITAT